MNNNEITQNATNEINILRVIKEAWTLVRGLKWPVFLFIILFPIAYHLIIMAVMFLFFPLSLIFSFSTPFLLIVFCLNFILMWGCFSILSILSVRHSIGLSTTINQVVKQCLSVKDKLFYLFLIWACILFTYIFLQLFLLPSGPLGSALHILL